MRIAVAMATHSLVYHVHLFSTVVRCSPDLLFFRCPVTRFVIDTSQKILKKKYLSTSDLFSYSCVKVKVHCLNGIVQLIEVTVLLNHADGSCACALFVTSSLHQARLLISGVFSVLFCFVLLTDMSTFRRSLSTVYGEIPQGIFVVVVLR